MNKEKSMYATIIKPIGDLILSIFFVVALSPVILIISILIASKDGFPVVFKQARIGKHGKLFHVYKFRTMVKNADKIGGTSTLKDDPRITRVGQILRKTSLDELLQLLNIVKGEMSVIGYRPDVFREKENYSVEKYDFKPGVTGLAQVKGRSSLTPEEKRHWENYYTNNISFKLDMIIFIETIKVVLLRKGSN